MSSAGNNPYTLSIQDVENPLNVISFSLNEELSTLFSVHLHISTDTPRLDLSSLMMKQAKLSLASLKNTKNSYNVEGIVIHAKNAVSAKGVYQYELQISSKLWAMTLTKRSCVFVDKDITYIIKSIMGNNHFSMLDYEFQLNGSYSPLEYVCQYNESDFDFLSRWMEEYGIYYYFDHNNGSKMIITDSAHSHKDNPQQQLVLQEGDAQVYDAKDDAITSFYSEYSPVPGSYEVNNFDPVFNHMKKQGSGTVTGKSSVKYNTYGGNPYVQNTFKEYATVEKERLRTQGNKFHCSGSVLPLICGFIVETKEDMGNEKAGKYLVINAVINGSFQSYINQTGQGTHFSSTYTVEFELFELQKQFRPKRNRAKPKIEGFLTATIDGQSDKTPYLDKWGRYKVVMPFDLEGKLTGKASCWVRMIQPSAANSERGFHISLLKGDEVVVGFVEGDIDRPLIVGAVNSREGVVGDMNHYVDRFRSLSGHEVVYDNTPGKECVGMKSSNGKVKILFGKV